ncbi:Pyruvate/Phosphoenolpyruvate kinase-like domain-containing protein [Staphylotrichum tortipilum]|uniref:Pyruvate/Phosphoenolpyruvate kinase-like domain-containing protein n=1 Tax=Staphylotrichum tortipilum TaxID=2831512 RepID=A0AAN6MN58_9PEZI|nr:Pyruvate/Phosphoenolpyruvate kinase-like domain-containing protein [Staphylotrichum longicolle]
MASSKLSVLRRALLYVPSTPRTLAKSLSFGFPVDNVTYDLEDSIPATSKSLARAGLRAHLAALSENRPAGIGEVAVRINAFSTGLAVDDLRAVAALPAVDAIVVPKVNRPADLALVEEVILDVAPTRTKPLKLLALIESARGIMDLREICGATPNLAGLIFAAEDFAADLGLRRTRDLEEMLYARSAVVTAAHAFRLESAIDLVCTSLSDEASTIVLRAETTRGKDLGFTGKQCIHPMQVRPVQAIFSPSKWEVGHAFRVVLGNEMASASGHGAWKLDGKMIDAPVVLKARRVLDRAKHCGMPVEDIRKEVQKRFARETSEPKGISIPAPTGTEPEPGASHD